MNFGQERLQGFRSSSRRRGCSKSCSKQMLRQPLFRPTIGRHYWENPASRWTCREDQEEGQPCQMWQRLVWPFPNHQVLWARQNWELVKTREICSKVKHKAKNKATITPTRTPNNDKHDENTYQTTLGQGPEVLARPMDQILPPRVAVEFPPLHPPVKMLHCGSENWQINEILTGFRRRNILFKLMKLWGKERRACEIWNLPANLLARDFAFLHRPVWKNSLVGPPS